MKIIFKIFFCFFILFGNNAYSQKFSIDNINKEISPSWTDTIYLKGTDSKALILFMPGGGGQPGSRDNFVNTLNFLKSKTKFSSGNYDLVVFISPKDLSENATELAWQNRNQSEHLMRIESVINFYKEKTKLPIILMGHSYGGISVQAFVKYIKENNKLNLLSGVIMSEAYNRAYDNLISINIPIIFVQHEQGKCVSTSHFWAKSEFARLEKTNKAPMSFISIKTGDAQLGKHPCSFGYHMYTGADEEFIGNLDIELNKIKFK
jgi:hypothetical protein